MSQDSIVYFKPGLVPGEQNDHSFRSLFRADIRKERTLSGLSLINGHTCV